MAAECVAHVGIGAQLDAILILQEEIPPAGEVALEVLVHLHTGGDVQPDVLVGIQYALGVGAVVAAKVEVRKAGMETGMALQHALGDGVQRLQRRIAAVAVEPAVGKREVGRLIAPPEGRGIADVPEHGGSGALEVFEHGVEARVGQVDARLLPDGGLGLDELDAIRAALQPVADVGDVVVAGMHQSDEEVGVGGVGALDREAVLVVGSAAEGAHAGQAEHRIGAVAARAGAVGKPILRRILGVHVAVDDVHAPFTSVILIKTCIL